MKLHELCDILQTYCYCGYAQDDVEIFSSDGTVFSVPNKVELKRDHDREVIAIELGME